MVRLVTEAGELILDKKTNISFQWENSVFMFENMRLNRTQNIVIKDIPENNLILGFGKNPKYFGYEMRTVIDCQLIGDSYVIDGKLHIENWDKNGYNACFYYGNLQVFSEISKAGKMNDYFKEMDFQYSWDFSTVPPQENSLLFAAYNHYTNRPTRIGEEGIAVLPSFNWLLFQRCIPSSVADFNFGNFENYVKWLFWKPNTSYGVQIIDEIPIEIYNNDLQYLETDAFEVVEHEFPYYNPSNNSAGKTALKGFKMKNDTVFTINLQAALIQYRFPFVFFNQNMKYYGATDVEVVKNWRQNYDEYFNNKITVSLLAGEEIYFQDITHFNVYIHIWNSPFPLRTPIGYFPDMELLRTSPALTDFKISNDENQPCPAIVDARLNLPDLTIMEFLQMYKKLGKFGYIVTPIKEYSGRYRMELFDYDFPLNQIHNIDEVLIEIKDVRRTFLDYGQKNTTKFKSLDNVIDKIEKTEYIYNQSLEDEIIIELPASETNYARNYTDIYAKSDIWEDNEGVWDIPQRELEVMYFDPTNTDNYKNQALQIRFNENKFLEKIIGNSTQVIADIKMNAFEFHKINEKDSFMLKGGRYACVSATWQNEIAELTLQLID